MGTGRVFRVFGSSGIVICFGDRFRVFVGLGIGRGVGFLIEIDEEFFL